MSDLFLKILNMSLAGGCAALIVMLIRLALRRAPKVYSYALWAVVFFRLIVPFTIPLPTGAIPAQVQTIPNDFIIIRSPSVPIGVPAAEGARDGAVQSVPASEGRAGGLTPVQTALRVGSYLWAAGFLALALYGTIGSLRLHRRVRTAIRLYGNVYETDRILSPFVFGLFRPKIYLPKGLGETEREYVLEHERVHIGRLDYLIKPAAFLVASVHWFNPAAWLSYVLLVRDMELSADERVLIRSGGDIREGYSHSLLALSAKKSGPFLPLAFGETRVKARIQNVLCYKKPAFWVSVAAVLVVAAVSVILLIGRQPEKIADPFPGESAGSGPVSEAASGPAEPEDQTIYDTVSIVLRSEQMGFKTADAVEITDLNTVARIETSIRSSLKPAEKADLKNNHTNEYTIRLSNKISSYSAGLFYDTLYDQAYLVNNGGIFKTDTNFARYIDSFLENGDPVFLTGENDAARLFRDYGWTLDYQIGTVNGKLDKLEVLPAFHPNAYYFAYHNELSKDIGLDMSGYAPAEVDVEIYRIYEAMPQEFYPIRNCRGIVVRSGGEIIGAFISAGRHSTFSACSLKGNGFESAAGQELEAWLAERINADKIEKALSRSEPEQIVAEYLTALDQKDARRAQYCIAKKTLLGSLTANLPNGELFSEGVALPLTDSFIGAKSSFSNLKSAKLLSIEPLDTSEEDVRLFRVTMDLQYREVVSIGSGKQNWDCSLVYESPQTGWKITGFGH